MTERATQGSDTIFAPASGQGSAGVAIIRISGPESHAIIQHITKKPLPTPRRLELRGIQDGHGELLDKALVVVFDKGKSFTREDMAEIHCHGGPAVVADVTELLLGHCRLAEPGEFTRRALLNGAIDLVDVEGLADLVSAETTLQRKQAMRIMQGELHDLLEEWRVALLKARALLEVTIDWVDEDVPENVYPEVEKLLAGLAASISQEINRSERTERLREGYVVAILGEPNVGKSSLLNAIAGRDVAITSEKPGTTRDLIEVRCNLDGLPVTFVDTAGIRETDDDLENIGIERARTRALSADLCLWLSTHQKLSRPSAELKENNVLSIWTKADLGCGPGDIHVSAVTGKGLDALIDKVRDVLLEPGRDFGLLGRLRQRDAVHETLLRVNDCLGSLRNESVEISAQLLSGASGSLEQLTGRLGTEHMLDELFSSFCLGK